MLYKEAVSKRILELCDKYNYTPNHLAETANIPSKTLYDVINARYENPSSYVIYKICKRLSIKLKEFYDNPLFDYENIID